MRSLLIVDDLPAIHEMLGAIVGTRDYLCAFALNGEEALRLYREQPFDAVLADVNMSPIDGLSLLRKLREQDPDARVLLMTGSTQREPIDAARRDGAFAVLQKPFPFDVLLETLDRATRGEADRNDPA
ncbi:MAG: response regulator [Opitutales bacterium]